VILSNIPNNESFDLSIEIPSISSIQELLTLLKDPKIEKAIYTKNKKTLTNFIDYNDIESEISIIEIPPKMRYLESFRD
jgi:DNA-binding transcriptional regulator WhiA